MRRALQKGIKERFLGGVVTFASPGDKMPVTMDAELAYILADLHEYKSTDVIHFHGGELDMLIPETMTQADTIYSASVLNCFLPLDHKQMMYNLYWV